MLTIWICTFFPSTSTVRIFYRKIRCSESCHVNTTDLLHQCPHPHIPVLWYLHISYHAHLQKISFASGRSFGSGCSSARGHSMQMGILSFESGHLHAHHNSGFHWTFTAALEKCPQCIIIIRSLRVHGSKSKGLPTAFPNVWNYTVLWNMVDHTEKPCAKL